MKGTDVFKETIKSFLDLQSITNELFAEKYSNPNKNIDDCVTHILNQVQKSGMNGFADQEIYSMAIHYYEEENIEVGKSISCQVVVNHVVELTEEEKAKIKEDAIKKAENEAYQKLVSKPVIKKKVGQTQIDLFA